MRSSFLAQNGRFVFGVVKCLRSFAMDERCGLWPELRISTKKLLLYIASVGNIRSTRYTLDKAQHVEQRMNLSHVLAPFFSPYTSLARDQNRIVDQFNGKWSYPPRLRNPFQLGWSEYELFLPISAHEIGSLRLLYPPKKIGSRCFPSC